MNDQQGAQAIKELWNTNPAHRAVISDQEAKRKWQKLNPDQRRQTLNEYYRTFGRYP